MKRLLSTFALLFLLTTLSAQTNVTLNINHQLADNDFSMNASTKNNLDHDFSVTRLAYYISGISLVHDGGLETTIDDFWILAKGIEPTQEALGEYDITFLEKVRFHIGVGPDYNHEDPASYPSGHPLAPTSPSMHWGWAPGYRFVAFEGKCGSDLSQTFQLHGLGDPNYLLTEIELNLPVTNNELSIDLDADYTKALENIGLTSGVIDHGGSGSAQLCLQNFNQFVFSKSNSISSGINSFEVSAFNTFPNPAVSSGAVNVEFDVQDESLSYDLSVSTIEGKQLYFQKGVQSGYQIDLSGFASGMYFVNLLEDGRALASDQLIVK